MARITRATTRFLFLEEVKNRLQNASRPWCWRHWLIVYNALIEPRKAEEIARHCGVSKATVHDVTSRYNRLGAAAIETPGKGGRRRQYLTPEEEKEFLAPFLPRPRGEIATVGQIWHALTLMNLFLEHVSHSFPDHLMKGPPDTPTIHGRGLDSTPILS